MTFLGRSSSLLLLILYKLLLAAVEILAGTLLLLASFFIKHPSVSEAITNIANKDRLDRFIYWLVEKTTALDIDYNVVLQIGLVLIALGIFKVFVAGGLWFKSKRMRVVALIIFGGLAFYSLYHLFLDFSILKALVLIVDVYIIYYFWSVLPKHLER